MSDLLREAMIDAKALREAALKNAEASIIDKYSAEVGKALQQLLENEEVKSCGVPQKQTVQQKKPLMTNKTPKSPVEEDENKDINKNKVADDKEVILGEQDMSTDDEEIETDGLFDDSSTPGAENDPMAGLEGGMDSPVDPMGGALGGAPDMGGEMGGGAAKEVPGMAGNGSLESKNLDNSLQLANIPQKQNSQTIMSLDLSNNQGTLGQTSGVDETSPEMPPGMEDEEIDLAFGDDELGPEMDMQALNSDNEDLNNPNNNPLEEEVVGDNFDEKGEGDPMYNGASDEDINLKTGLRQIKVKTGMQTQKERGTTPLLTTNHTKPAVEKQVAALQENVDKMLKVLETLQQNNRNLKNTNSTYLRTIEALKETVEKSNLSIARLIYENKALRDLSLNERQREQIVEQIAKAASVDEAKMIFETVKKSSGTVSSKKTLLEIFNKGEMNPSFKFSKLLNETKVDRDYDKSDPTVLRNQKLAGIINQKGK